MNFSDFTWPFLTPYMGVIPNPKMVFIFPISCILVLIFPFFMIYFPKCAGKGSFPKSQIKSLNLNGSVTNITLRLSQKASLSDIHHNYAFYKLRDHFLTRRKIIMMKMTDISFIYLTLLNL